MEIRDFINKILLPVLAEDFKGKIDMQLLFESVYKAADKAKATS